MRRKRGRVVQFRIRNRKITRTKEYKRRKLMKSKIKKNKRQRKEKKEKTTGTGRKKSSREGLNSRREN